MELLVGVLLGIVTAVVLIAKPIKFELHVTHETITPTHDMVNMAEVMNRVDTPEDKAYDDMGDALKEINENISKVFGGSDRV